MRLIDADALLEQYNLKDATKYGNKDAKQQEHSYSTMMMYEIADMIEDATTAYDVDSVVQQIKTLSPANYVSKDDVLKIVKCDKVSPKSEKNSFFDFDEVLRIECDKARSKAIDDFVAEFKNEDSELWKSCNNWYEFADRIAEQLKKEVGE